MLGVDENGGSAIVITNMVMETEGDAHAAKGVGRALRTVIVLLGSDGVQRTKKLNEASIGTAEGTAGAKEHVHASGAPRVSPSRIVEDSGDDLRAPHAAM